MLTEMSSKEITEWKAYFKIKDERQKEEEAKIKAEAKAKGAAKSAF